MIGWTPDLLVLARLLDALASAPGPERRTPLQQRAGVNYTVFQRYLEFLVRHGMVEPSAQDPDRFALTPKGIEAHRFLTEGLRRIFGTPRVAPAERAGAPGPGDRVTRPGTS
jgi:predicted transcriptional regulator